MPRPKIGKAKFNQSMADCRDELGLINTLLNKLLSNNLTTTARVRLIAQISLASTRIGTGLTDLDDIARRAAQSGELADD